MMDFVKDVVPISDLRTKAAQIIARIHQTRQPVLVTQRGRSVAVLLDVAEYQCQQRKMALLMQSALDKRDGAGILANPRKQRALEALSQQGYSVSGGSDYGLEECLIPAVTLGQVREGLASMRGSLAQEVSDERDER